MAKTLVYAPGSPRQVKIGDTDTVLYLQIAKDNVSVDLTKVQAIQVKIADKESFLKTITIDKSKLAYDPTNGVVELPMSKDNIGGLPTNTYQFEVWITTADSENEIYPDVGVAVFSIINNIEGGSVVYTSLTLQDFYNAFSDLAITAKNDHNTAVADSAAVQQNTQTANAAATSAQQALNELNSGGYAKQTDITSAIGSLNYDNRNLLEGTSADYVTVTNATGWNTNFPYWGLGIAIKLDKVYTLRAYLKPSSHSVHVQLIYIDSSGSTLFNNGNDIVAGNEGYSSVTVTVPTGATINGATIAFAEQESDSTQGMYKAAKLEPGKYSTPWLPYLLDYEKQLADIKTQLTEDNPSDTKGYSSDGCTFLNGTSLISGGYKTLEFPTFRIHHIKISLNTSLSAGSVNLVQFPINLGGIVNFTTLDGAHLVQSTSDNKLKFLWNLNGSSYPTYIDVAFIVVEDK